MNNGRPKVWLRDRLRQLPLDGVPICLYIIYIYHYPPTAIIHGARRPRKCLTIQGNSIARDIRKRATQRIRFPAEPSRGREVKVTVHAGSLNLSLKPAARCLSKPQIPPSIYISLISH